MDKKVSRRDFMVSAAQAGAILTLPGMLLGETKAPAAAPAPAAKPASPQKSVSMVKLPYAENALEPFISARTVNLHYTKHHQGYLTMISTWIDTHPEFQNQTLEELIFKYKNGTRFEEAIFDYSILLFNHNWYWQSLKPKAGGIPKGNVEKMILASYGSFDAFKKTIADEGMKLGVGWVWIVQDGEKINVYRSEYLDNPMLKGLRPLLAIDVWEHAYYLDYQNDRRKYIDAVVNNLLNWDFAEQNIVLKAK